MTRSHTLAFISERFLFVVALVSAIVLILSKNLREGKGKSVYALSKETGVSENHIHSIEKGSTQPSVAILERLLNALGVTLPEFFNEDREVLYPSAYERELIASVRKLDGEQAHVLLQLAKWLEL